MLGRTSSSEVATSSPIGKQTSRCDQGCHPEHTEGRPCTDLCLNNFKICVKLCIYCSVAKIL